MTIPLLFSSLLELRLQNIATEDAELSVLQQLRCPQTMIRISSLNGKHNALTLAFSNKDNALPIDVLKLQPSYLAPLTFDEYEFLLLLSIFVNELEGIRCLQ